MAKQKMSLLLLNVRSLHVLLQLRWESNFRFYVTYLTLALGLAKLLYLHSPLKAGQSSARPGGTLGTARDFGYYSEFYMHV